MKMRWLTRSLAVLSLALSVLIAVAFFRSPSYADGLLYFHQDLPHQRSEWAFWSDKQTFELHRHQHYGDPTTYPSLRHANGLDFESYGPREGLDVEWSPPGEWLAKGSFKGFNLSFPDWFAEILALSLSLPWLISRHRRAKAGKLAEKTVCPVCGYDLRASPERCPECGEAKANTV